MRLINADGLMRGLELYGEKKVYADVVLELVKQTPTIDAVEVVRCRDCKHKYVSGNGTTQYYVCDFMDAQYEDNGFCHHGESEVEE